jgi:hypothetical protein
VTRAARVTAELYSPRRVKLYRRGLSVRAGSSIVKLRMPKQVRRVGVYSLRFTALAGGESVTRKLAVRFLTKRAGAGPRQPVEIVLAGAAPRTVRTGLPRRKPMVVSAYGVEPAFDLAASRAMNVRVIVVDVEEFGLGFLRDLHAVFPTVRIVALSSSPMKLAVALRSGAAAALPRSASPALVAKTIQRLLRTSS